MDKKDASAAIRNIRVIKKTLSMRKRYDQGLSTISR